MTSWLRCLPWGGLLCTIACPDVVTGQVQARQVGTSAVGSSDSKTVAASEMVVIGQSADGSGNGSNAREPALAADGGSVVYVLKQNREGGPPAQLHRYDVSSGASRVLSVTADGALANADCNAPTVSRTGALVAFDTTATNLCPELRGRFRDICLLDAEQGRCRRMLPPDIVAEGDVHHPVLSSDGKWVAFTGSSSLLSSEAARREGSDAFLYDIEGKSLECISHAVDGTAGNGRSAACNVSDGGRYVAFLRYATNLLGVDDDAKGGVFVRDRKSKTTRSVSGRAGMGRDLGVCMDASASTIAMELVLAGSGGASETSMVAFGPRDSESLSRIGERLQAQFPGSTLLGCSMPFLSSNGKFLVVSAEFPQRPSEVVAAGVVVPVSAPVVLEVPDEGQPTWRPIVAPSKLAGRCIAPQVDSSGKVLCFQWMGDKLTEKDVGIGSRIVLVKR